MTRSMKCRVLYKAIATKTAPPSMATASRFNPAVVNAAAPVWRPGGTEVVVVGEPVGLTYTMVVEVRVLRLPFGMVVVLLYVVV